MAYAIEPFRFNQASRALPASSLKRDPDRLRQQPGLFGKVRDGQVNKFKYMHVVGLKHSAGKAPATHLEEPN